MQAVPYMYWRFRYSPLLFEIVCNRPLSLKTWLVYSSLGLVCVHEILTIIHKLQKTFDLPDVCTR